MADESAKIEQSMAADKNDREVVEQFCMLMEKARKLFDGLRSALDQHYKLERWQIGEIASKIGQLYYNYYLRTSESNYLFEAFQFYSAIRSRNYFNQTGKEERPGMLLKRLRYYVRFLVVGLLLNEFEVVRDLVKDLKRCISEYTSSVDDDDEAEWQLVLKEAIAFIEADSVLTVMGEDVMPVTLKHRVAIEKIPSTKSKGISNLRLDEVIIVGNCERQTRFSELTLDMFRFLQCVEKEPESLQSYKMKVTGSELAKIKGDGGERKNPHKYLLYKPSFGQLMTFLSASFKDLPANGIIMLYLSADALIGNDTKDEDGFYEAGGVVTNKKKDAANFNRAGNMKEAHCLFPEDLVAFTRKPMVLVVDSPNSFAFKNIPKLFGQPLVCFMSPVQYPEDVAAQKDGGLFTLFCYDPLLAFCTVCHIADLRHELWERCQQYLNKILAEELEILYSSIKDIDCAFEQFLCDEFIRLLMLRFIFCYQTLRLHKHYKGPAYYPSISPPLCVSIFNHKGFARHILELASILDAGSFFNEWTEISGFDFSAM